TRSGPAIARRPAPNRARKPRASVPIRRLLLTLVARRLDVRANLNVALVARVLEDLVVVVQHPRVRRRPRPRLHHRVRDGDLVLEAVVADTREAFGDVKLLARRRVVI